MVSQSAFLDLVFMALAEASSELDRKQTTQGLRTLLRER
jgi:hypothetical protein